MWGCSRRLHDRSSSGCQCVEERERHLVTMASEQELEDNVDGLLDDLLQMTNSFPDLRSTEASHPSESPSTGARMEVSPTGCWSLQIVGPHHDCIPGFVVGAGHFKNKFCERCRTNGIMVAAERVCLATPALKDLAGRPRATLCGSAARRRDAPKGRRHKRRGPSC